MTTPNESLFSPSLALLFGPNDTPTATAKPIAKPTTPAKMYRWYFFHPVRGEVSSSSTGTPSYTSTFGAIVASNTGRDGALVSSSPLSGEGSIDLGVVLGGSST